MKVEEKLFIEDIKPYLIKYFDLISDDSPLLECLTIDKDNYTIEDIIEYSLAESSNGFYPCLWLYFEIFSNINYWNNYESIQQLYYGSLLKDCSNLDDDPHYIIQFPNSDNIFKVVYSCKNESIKIVQRKFKTIKIEYYE